MDCTLCRHDLGFRQQDNDRTIDDKSGCPKLCAARAGDKAVADQALHRSDICLKKVLTGGNHLRSPFGQVNVPKRAVTSLARIPSQKIQRIALSASGRSQALTLGVVCASLAVDERDEESSRGGCAVIIKGRSGIEGGRIC